MNKLCSKYCIVFLILLTISLNDNTIKMEVISLNDIKITMPKKQLETLTEPMYYTLIALLEPRCGMEITEFVLTLTKGRVHLVPGTLYTMLSKFEQENLIREVAVNGRKRYYYITEKGREMLEEEYARIQLMLEEGRAYILKNKEWRQWKREESNDG